jgi:hypothetical protein
MMRLIDQNNQIIERDVELLELLNLIFTGIHKTKTIIPYLFFSA